MTSNFRRIRETNLNPQENLKITRCHRLRCDEQENHWSLGEGVADGCGGLEKHSKQWWGPSPTTSKCSGESSGGAWKMEGESCLSPRGMPSRCLRILYCTKALNRIAPHTANGRSYCHFDGAFLNETGSSCKKIHQACPSHIEHSWQCGDVGSCSQNVNSMAGQYKNCSPTLWIQRRIDLICIPMQKFNGNALEPYEFRQGSIPETIPTAPFFLQMTCTGRFSIKEISPTEWNLNCWTHRRLWKRGCDLLRLYDQLHMVKSNHLYRCSISNSINKPGQPSWSTQHREN